MTYLRLLRHTVLVACVVVHTERELQALPPLPEGKPYTTEQNAWLAERSQFREKIARMASEDIGQAVSMAEKMVTIDRQVFGNGHREVADSLDVVADLYYRNQDYRSSVKTQDEILAIVTQLLGEKNWRVKEQRFYRNAWVIGVNLPVEGKKEINQAHELQARCTKLMSEKKFDDSLAAGKQAALLFEKYFGKNNPYRAGSLFRQAQVCYEQNRLAQAEVLLVESAEIYRDFYGAESTWYGETQGYLGSLYKTSGSLLLAERAYRSALLVSEHEKMDDYSRSMLRDLGGVYLQQGKPAQAEEFYLKAADIVARKEGTESEGYFTALADVSNAQTSLGHLDKAEKNCRIAYEGYKRYRATSPATFLRISDKLCGILLRRDGKAREVLSVIQEARDALTGKGADQYGELNLLYCELEAHLALQEFRAADAAGLKRLQLASELTKAGASKQYVLDSVVQLCNVATLWSQASYRSGNFAEGREQIGRAVQYSETHFGKMDWKAINNRHTAEAFDNYSKLNENDRSRSDEADKTVQRAAKLASQRDYPAACSLYEEALKTRKDLYPPGDLWIIHWSANLALAYQSSAKPGLAEALLQDASRGLQELFGLEHAPPLLRDILVTQALCSEERQDFLSAVAYLHDAERLSKSLGQTTGMSHGEILSLLARAYIEIGEMERAEALLTELMSRFERQFGSESVQVGLVYHNLAVLTARNRDLTRSADYSVKGLARVKSQLDALAAMMIDAAQNMNERGEFNLAISFLELSASNLELLPGPRQQYWYTACRRELARAYQRVGRFEDAEKMARDAVERQQQKFPGVIAACEREVEILSVVMSGAAVNAVMNKRPAEAKAIAAREAAFFQNLLGENHWRTRVAQDRLKLYTRVAKFDAAKSDRFVAALDGYFRARVLPPSTLLEPLERALAELDSLVGKDNFYYQQGRLNLLNASRDKKDVAAALVQATEVQAAVEKLFGRDCPLSGSGYLWLGYLTEMQGNYEAAIKHFTTAAELFSNSVGSSSLSAATANVHLGGLHVKHADYPRAVAKLRRALAILSSHQEMAEYFNCLTNYGVACSALGNSDRAEILLQRAYRYAKSTGAQDSARLIDAAQILGGHYYKVKDYERAEPLYREALELIGQTGQEKSDSYAACLIGLANILRDKGDNLLPGPMYDQALSGMAAREGAQSVYSEMALNERGRMRLSRGALELAQEDFEKASAIRKGLRTGLVIVPELGDIAFQMQDRALALKRYDEALTIWHNSAAVYSAAQTETQQLTNAQKQHELLSRMLSVDPIGDELDMVYRRVLAWKGAVFARQSRMRSLRGKPELQPQFREWEQATGKLATLALHVPYPEDRDIWLMQMHDATNEYDLISAQLAAAGGSVPELLPTPVQLAEALPEKTVLVDFVEYFRRVPKPGQKGKWIEERSLVAFVIRNGRPIERIGLGASLPAAEEINAWLKAVAFNEPGKQASVSELAIFGKLVRKRIWEPLKPSLEGAQTILVASDGPLSRFPLAALPGEADLTFLAEEVGIVMLPVPSLLPQLLHAPTPSVDAPLLALGDVDYGGSASLADARRVLTQFADGSRSWLPMGFGPLENTGPEIDSVRNRFTASFPNAPDLLVKRRDCTEERFRQLAPKARWLHLATHGFYMPDLIKSVFEGNSGATPADQATKPGEIKLGVRLHPGLLSGLALSGVNVPKDPEEDDGILSAMEVASLNLSNVELAVLSACETAQGQEAGGEGVLGLQRAFQVSGARSVVATLWPIHDAATRLLMMRFYRNLWEKKMTKLESLRDAQLWMLTSARAAQRAGKNPESFTLDSDQLPPMLLHPSIWAPFVLSGDWQ